MSTSISNGNGSNVNSSGKVLLFRRRRGELSRKEKLHYPISEGLEVTTQAAAIFKRKVLLRGAVNGRKEKIKKLSFRSVIPKIRQVWSGVRKIGHSSEGGDIYVAEETEWGEVYFVAKRSNKINGGLVIVTILDGKIKAKKLMGPKEERPNNMRQAFKFR